MHAKPIIQSLQNPKIKQLMRLRKARERKIQQLTLVEGLREIQRAREGAATLKRSITVKHAAHPTSSKIMNFIAKLKRSILFPVQSLSLKKLPIEHMPMACWA